VSFGVNGAVDVDAGEQVIVRGVRGQIDLSPGSVVGSSIIAQLTTSPATIAAFGPVQQDVARSADPLIFALTPVTIIQCRPAGTAIITVTEGFNTAWVDHDNDPTDVFTPATTINDRPLFGGTNNSRITIVVTSRPTGVTVVWPATSSVNVATGARLDLNAGSTNDTATYTFSTPDQAVSDVNAEAFTISLVVSTVVPGTTNNIRIGGTVADFGTAFAQGQMTPIHTSTGSRPRYNHPLENVPAGILFTVVPCTTNLLYPWVVNFAGLDTGIAISNTSMDPYGTVTQAGTCSVNLYPTDKTTNNGVNAGGAVTVTTQSVAAGSVWRSTLSGQTGWAGLAGYIIAVCNFQYGHGFAFLTDNFGVGAPGAAQGYLALVIPDPVLLGGVTGCGIVNNPAGKYRSAAIGATDKTIACFPPYGEGLAQ
jgi:ABC-type molybdate transport system substrate-binding protein